MMVIKSKKLNQFLNKLLHKSRYDTPTSARSAGTGVSFSFSELFGSSSNSHRCCDLSAVMDANYDDVEEACRSDPPKDVPPGSLPVYVGQERRRFVIPTTFLSNNIFRTLLAKSEEEYGLRCDGGLRIACAPYVFEHILWWLEGEKTPHVDEMKHTCSSRFRR